MNKEEAIITLRIFIKEMGDTLTDPNKKNRLYAPEVFWKNKDSLEAIANLLEAEQ